MNFLAFLAWQSPEDQHTRALLDLYKNILNGKVQSKEAWINIMLYTLFCYEYVNPSGDNRIINILKKKIHIIYKEKTK